MFSAQVTQVADAAESAGAAAFGAEVLDTLEVGASVIDAVVGLTVGVLMGISVDGIWVVGFVVGIRVEGEVGTSVIPATVGVEVGMIVGEGEGSLVGVVVGSMEGDSVGVTLGVSLGVIDGAFEGLVEGEALGVAGDTGR